MKAHIITIGDEILIGQIVDTNSAWMGQQLNLVGARVTAIKTAQDDHREIIRHLADSLQSADVVLMTGGLGATKDDITKKAIASFLGSGMVFHQETFDRIQRYFEKIGRSHLVGEALRQQCFMPESATLLRNDKGTAPGMWFEVEGKIIVSMPGVPYEMKHLMSDRVLPRLTDTFGTRAIYHRTLLTAGHGETDIAKRIEEVEASLPENVKLAYLPNLGEVRLRLSAVGYEGDSADDLQTLVDAKAKEIETIMGDAIFGYGDSNIQEVLGSLLMEKGLRLGTAESCTGGNIAARLVRTPGSSRYFEGGVIAYSNQVKMKQLGVSPDTIDKHGAVSEQTVREMVTGTLKALGVDIAVAVSGIAGPDGGRPDKPVGTIWVAVGDKGNTRALRLQLGKDRLNNIEYTTKHALNLARLFLLRQ